MASMTINPNEIARVQNGRQNAIDRVQGLNRASVHKDKKKNARKYACRKKGRQDW